MRCAAATEQCKWGVHGSRPMRVPCADRGSSDSRVLSVCTPAAAVLKVDRNANFGKLQAGYLFPEVTRDGDRMHACAGTGCGR